jgi:HSP20 family molecular chaperone IbpA
MTSRGFRDIFVEDSIVRIVVDLSGMNKEDVWLGVSMKKNSFIIKYVLTNAVLEIPIPVKITEDFEWFMNNGVLEVEIKR